MTHTVRQDSYLEFDHIFKNCHERGKILKLQDVITSLTLVTSQGRAPPAEEAPEVEGDDVGNQGPGGRAILPVTLLLLYYSHA